MKKKVLVFAAHPDDEILGCGAALSKYKKGGSEIFVVILGEGIMSRKNANPGELKKLHKESEKANKIIGADKLFFENLPDNRFDSVDMLDVVRLAEKYIDKFKPDIIFTHHENDLNIDHQITHKAVLTACRPQPGFKFPDIYAFEIPSSTEWGGYSRQNIFIPNLYIDISGELNVKLKALKSYKTELRKYPHPRSLKGVEILARNRGQQAGIKYAEAFLLIKSIKSEVC